MDGTCGTCVCSSARKQASDGRLVLATAVDHTATALRTLALRRGTRLIDIIAEDTDPEKARVLAGEVVKQFVKLLVM